MRMSYVTTYEEWIELKTQHEVDNNLSYIVSKSIGVTKKDHDLDILNPTKWHFVDPKCKFQPKIESSHPFFLVGKRVYDCQHGPDRHRKRKERRQMQIDDHSYRQKRCLLQDTKKIGCEAKLRVREVLVMKDIQVSDTSRMGIVELRKELRAVLQQPGFKLTSLERRYYYHIPSVSQHKGHLTGDAASHLMHIDKSLRVKVQEIVSDGVRRPAEVKRLLNLHVNKEIFGGKPPKNPSRRFCPTNRDITNMVQAALEKNRYSPNDQENVAHFVESNRQSEEGNLFFLRKKSSEISSDQGDFLFVHQNAWQRYILNKYGQDICLLDATYSTTKYDMPCFFVCVQTNHGYVNVALLILEHETTASIAEGLSIIQKWNPNWNPKSFLCDFDEREISAIETTFPACMVYLCDFHREQAWERWLGKDSHGLRSSRDEVKSLLRAVANAMSEVEYESALHVQKESTYWKNNQSLRSWLNTKWLPCHKRWVKVHRLEFVNIINTTNGIEHQHRDFKINYLEQFSDHTLAGLVSTLITKFLPECQRRYEMNNVKASDMSKKYSQWVPPFLTNRPHSFIKHALPRLGYETSGNIGNHGEKKFTVPSEASRTEYIVDIGSDIPHCGCQDWARFHLPCKHMWVLVLQGLISWEDFPQKYRDCPVFSLDLPASGDVIATENPNDANSVPVVEVLDEEVESPQLLNKPVPSSATLARSLRENLKLCYDSTFNLQHAPLADVQLKNIFTEALTNCNLLKKLLTEKLPKLEALTLKNQKHTLAAGTLKLRKTRRKYRRMKAAATRKLKLTMKAHKSLVATKRVSTEPVSTCAETATEPVATSAETATEPVATSAVTAKEPVATSAVTATEPVATSAVTAKELVGTSAVTATEPVATSEVTATESVATSEVTATEPVATSAVTATEPVATSAVTATEPVATSEVTATEPVATSAVTATEPVATSEVTATEPVATSAVTAKEPVATSAVTAKELVGTSAVTATEPVATSEVTAKESVATSEVTATEPVATSAVTAKELIATKAVATSAVKANKPVPIQPVAKRRVSTKPVATKPAAIKQVSSEPKATKEVKATNQVATKPVSSKADGASLVTPADSLPKRKHKIKPRSSSWFYPPLKKRKVFCVCQKPNDGKLYWQCDKCGKWYHPPCVGRSDGEDVSSKSFLGPCCDPTEIVRTERQIPRSSQCVDSHSSCETQTQFKKKELSCDGKITLPVLWEIIEHAPKDVILARQGPYPLSSTDFLSLKGISWLTDQVIDAYLHLLCTAKLEQIDVSVFHFPTQVITAIVNGVRPPLLQKERLAEYDLMVGIYLQGSCHWTAVAITSDQICYYDSYGEKQYMMAKIEQGWRRFVEKRHSVGLDGTIVNVVPSGSMQRQKDAHNCGIFALKFLHEHITRRAMPAETPAHGRNFIAKALYSLSDLADISCSRCGSENGDLETCKRCACRFHVMCTSLDKRCHSVCFSCDL